MRHKLTGIVRRTVQERYDIEVEANTHDEACDIAYAILSDYPESELFGVRLLCKTRAPEGDPEVLSIHAEGYDVNDLEEEDEEDFPA